MPLWLTWKASSRGRFITPAVPVYRAPHTMINYVQGNTLGNISRVSTGLDIGGIAHGNYR